MGLSHSPKIVTDGLVLCLDAGNANKSARGFKNLLNLSTWTVSTGSVTGFSAIGTAGQNEDRRILDTGPFGVSALVWDTPSNDATSDADGGWNTSNINIDNTKLYRFSVWLRRKTIGNGAYYLGCAGGVLNRSDGVLNNNPYFSATSWPVSIVANEWMLVVGHIWPVNSGTGTNHVDSGLWNTSGTKFSGPTSSGDFVWQTTSTTTYHRSYLYYSTDITTNQQWYQPRVDLCDGTEPTIAELIAGVGSKWYDLTGTNHGNILNSAALYDSAGYMNFDSVDDYLTLPNSLGYTTFFSAFAWFKSKGTPTGGYHIVLGGQELELSVPTAGQLRTGLYTNARFVQNDGSGLSDGNWHYIGFTYDGATKTAYIDGNSVGTQSITGTLTSSFSNRTVGKFGSDPNYFANAYISNISIYNRALSSVEILKNFNALRGRFGV